ncbi:MAG: AhpC/TSA family protein [Dysgonamonadaceae bacterium]|jgi:thiol-disulfide isomerase/thioredoxin|nr:AhpC/TSA family protein [Dysgonamonadaceae bacterium]
MKRIFFIVVALVVVFTSGAQENFFELSGTVKGKSTGYIYLTLTDFYNERISDSTQIRNEQFVFTGNISYPVMAFLSADKSVLSSEGNANAVSFFLDPGKTAAKLVYQDFKNIVLSGSKTNQESKDLEKLKAAEKIASANSADFKALSAKIDADFISKHPDSFLSAYLLRGRIFNREQTEALFSQLTDAVKQSGFGRVVQRSIDESKIGVPGTKALDFSAVDINGDSLSLSGYKGQYVLIDFWASWCKPCRASHPHLLELYAKYKDKGFEIIAISDDDRNPDAWRKAVANDKVNVWRHILRGLDMKRLLKGDANYSDYPNEISASRYGVTSLPTKVLVDPSGTIIGRYTGSTEALFEEKLKEVFGD